jgi:hypothetical protein
LNDSSSASSAALRVSFSLADLFCAEGVLSELGLLDLAVVAGLLGLVGRLAGADGDAVEEAADAGRLAAGCVGDVAGREADLVAAAAGADFFKGAPQNGQRSASSSRTD